MSQLSLTGHQSLQLHVKARFRRTWQKRERVVDVHILLLANPVRPIRVRIPLIADIDSTLIADSVPRDRGHPSRGPGVTGWIVPEVSGIRMERCPRSAWNRTGYPPGA